jgi:hypothetical protein
MWLASSLRPTGCRSPVVCGMCRLGVLTVVALLLYAPTYLQNGIISKEKIRAQYDGTLWWVICRTCVVMSCPVSCL